MSKTACIVPWSSLVLGPDGRATFCCDAPVPLNVSGHMGRVDRDSLEDLWNSPDLVQVRSGMARGERPGACGVCWEREAAGGVSRRLLTNAAYRQMGGRLAVEELPREGAANGFHLERRPDWFILELGNVCNLKCRSCSALFSSRIAGDPVHEAWTTNARAAAGGSGGAGGERGPRRRLEIVPESASAWWDDVEHVADMIASGATGNAMLSLLGGEPFLMARTWRLLNALVARGVAPRLLVALATNGQHRGESLEELAPRFRGFSLTLSIDGHGRLYEYLRHGARWHRLVENLGWFRQLPKVDLMAVPTLQNYNALDMVTLLRFLDEHELRLSYNVVSWPARLRPANLPPSVRRIAARRLHAYLDAECRPANLSVVRGWCEILEEAGEEFDAGRFDEFMAFTNDLDADRGESLREAAPELFDLIRAAGVVWPGAGRLSCAGVAWPAFQQEELLRRVNRTVSSRDAIFAGFESVHTGAYFTSGLSQLAEIDGRLREHGHPGLAGCRAIADFGCHYGRFTRAVRAALPHVAVYACDIDAEAVRFCAGELGALPVLTGWKPDEESLPGDLDVVVCISLLTHTPLEHWRRALRAWARMLRPGGAVAFTFLSESHLEAWLAGTMEHYGSYSRQQRDTAVRALREEGCGFASLTSGYGGEPLYGVSFTCTEVVRREIAAAGLELLALPSTVNPAFGQDLALARKPAQEAAPEAASTARTVHRDVTLVALYDPRGYTPARSMPPTSAAVSGLPAPPDIRDGGHASGIWSRLAAAYPARSLPTELGFCDPRLAEVREAQAALASEHGVDAFCYLFLWGEAGPRWDAPWRDLLTTGRPDFPFCLMIDLPDGGSLSALSAAAAERLFEDILPGLADRRYLRLEDRALLLVRDAARLVEPRSIAAAWRAAATAGGLGGLHLCAVEPVPAERPSDLGFDSFLEAPAAAGDHVGVAAAALARPWPRHRLLRTVQCRRDRDAGGARGDELYEHWLRSTVDATRRRGEKLVFVDAWNDWLGGLYLEPDDREGRAALMATRRAARGPGSGLVLVRQLGDALGRVEGPAAALLGELRQVLELHEGARDRLLASVEVALGRNPLAGGEALRWVPVASRQLPPSGGGLCLDQVGGAGGPEIQGSREPLVLRGDEVHLAGWAHTGTCAPTEVDLFLALESSTGGADRIFPVAERVARLDVVAAFPGHPARCGFDTVVNLAGMAPGTYSITIVQRTPEATYRDATGVTVRRDGAPCSKG